MTFEHMRAPDGKDVKESGTAVPHITSEDNPARVWENLAKIAENRLKGETSEADLKEFGRLIKLGLVLTAKEGRETRLEKMGLLKKLSVLREQSVQFRRSKLAKSSEIASLRAGLAKVKEEIKDSPGSEIAGLEKALAVAQDDVEAFSETLKLHRRDRNRAFDKLIDAKSRLSDIYTEMIIWAIIDLESSERAGESRTGLSGITAEFLGRILVIEKELAQLKWLISVKHNMEK